MTNAESEPTVAAAAAPPVEQQGQASPEKTTEKTNGQQPAAPTAAAPKVKPVVHKVDYEKDVVYLYQFSRFPTLPSASPFCLKVETWLRMAGIKYENVDHKLKYKSKKGQLPFVELNGQEVADSDIIIQELSGHFKHDLDTDLTADQRNVSHAFISMLNNHTSWVMRWWRYSHPGQFLKTAQVDVKRALNSKLPKGLLHFIFKMSLKSNVKRAVSHGLGRHTMEEIIQFGKNDLKALSQHLAQKKFFFGDEPHLLDCVAFAHLCQFVYVPFGDLKEFMDAECSNLVSFVTLVKERYWQDWDEMCSTLDLNTHLPKPPPPVEEEKKDEGKGSDDEKKAKKEGEEEKKPSSEAEDKDQETEKQKDEVKEEPKDNKEAEEASEKAKEEEQTAKEKE